MVSCCHKKTSVVSIKLISAVNKIGSANIVTRDMELLAEPVEVAKIDIRFALSNPIPNINPNM
nr:hypothetical protein [uncultured Clostridium sp.]